MNKRTQIRLNNANSEKTKEVKQAKNKQEDFSISVEAKKQILGFFVFITGLLLFLSVVSYSEKDQSTLERLNLFSIFRRETYSSAYEIFNWLGIAGALISQFFILNLFGYFSLIIPVLVMFAGILFILKKPFSEYYGYFIYSLTMMVLLGTIMGLSKILFGSGSISTTLSGTSGDFLATIIYKTIGSVGSSVLLLILLALNVFLIIDGSIVKSLARIKHLFDSSIDKYKAHREKLKEEKILAEEKKKDELLNTEKQENINLKDDEEKPETITDKLKKEREKLRKLKYENTVEESDEDNEEKNLIKETEINRPKREEKISKNNKSKEENFTSDKSILIDKEVKQDASEIDINPENSNETERLTGVDEDDYIEERLDKYKFPTIDLLIEPTEEDNKIVSDEECKMNGRLLQEKLLKFGIEIEKVSATPGPVVTLYELIPAADVKLSKIESLQDDIALALKAKGIRMIIPIPGKGTVGVEIPNSKAQMVRVKSIIDSDEYKTSKKILPVAFGKTIDGHIFIDDLAKMPHLLIAGATGSGKSVGINTIITSLLYKMHPSDLKFVLIDPKKIELNLYSKLKKHYLSTTKDINESIVTSPTNAVSILKSLVSEMEKRYDKLANAGVRNIEAYNQKYKDGKLKDNEAIRHKKMPYIVVIIDELADLMITAKREIEEPIARLAQMARAVGIHLIVATQRPSVDVITGVIKANFPVRIAYQVASKIDSRTILDMGGADALLRNGDMLYLSSASPKPIRIQNAYISTEECEDIVEFVGKQEGFKKLHLLPSVIDTKSIGTDYDDERDLMFNDVARLVFNMQQCSTSVIQRRLKIGYARAARIVDQMEKAGIVGPNNGAKGREILVTGEELEDILTR
ncbi:MAG: DNA translocase FtsK [Ignavibacteria bacterium]|nr:DNA translocase FtsK [Ignavibacteria bacterium]